MEHKNPDATSITHRLPLIHSILYEEYENECIPGEIKTSTAAKRQSTERLELVEQLNVIFKPQVSPILTIPTRIHTGDITIEFAIHFYQNLIEFLDSEPYNKRLILYLSFELLPELTWRSSSKRLNEVIFDFVQVYIKNWKLLIYEYDLEADFIDGDLLDNLHIKGLSPRVSKACHLIPILVEKGLLSVQKDVLEVIKKSDNPIIRNSTADALTALARLGLLSKTDIQSMKRSSDGLIQNMAMIIENMSLEEKRLDIDKEDLFTFLANMERELQKEPESHFHDGSIKNEKRIAWEKTRNAEKMIDIYAGKLSTYYLATYTIDIPEIIDLIKSDSSDYYKAVIVTAIRNFCVELSIANLHQSIVVANMVLREFKKIYKTAPDYTRESIEVTFNHWANCKLITNKRHIDSRRLERRILDSDIEAISDVEKLKKFTKVVLHSEQLSTLIFPVTILYGSKVKGYAKSKTADSDIAIFVKPGITLEQRTLIQDLVTKALQDSGLSLQPIEFWLDQKNDCLEIHNFDFFDNLLGDSSLVHVLFNGIWIGSSKVMSEISQKIIPPYLKVSDDRNTWLKELERTVLQYRLMHKGYSRFYPRVSGIITKEFSDIRGDSTFWDTNFRRLATKLFLSNVYIPLLEM